MPKEIEDENSINADDILDDVKVKLQSAIANMSPKKFEQFSRALLTKMGVQFTDKGLSLIHISFILRISKAVNLL